MTWAPVISTIGTIFAGFFGAGIAAWLGFQQWRKQRWFENREKIAVEVLTDFYDARSVLEWVRMPGAYEGEGKTREAEPSETPEIEGARNAFFTPVERMQAHKEMFSRMDAARFKVMALFGPDSEEPFSKMIEVRNKIYFASHGLVAKADELPDETTKRDKAIIWSDPIKKDELANEIDGIISEIEVICRPILTPASAKKWSL